jgi:hypothetical protein
MPLRPDLGGFGMYWLFKLLLPCRVDRMLLNLADKDSGQDQSVWSEFPARFLQDALLGFQPIQTSKVPSEEMEGFLEALYPHIGLSACTFCIPKAVQEIDVRKITAVIRH